MLMVLILIVASFVFLILVALIDEAGRKNIRLFWKIVKFEFILAIFINLFIYIAKSLKLGTFKNSSLLFPAVLIVFFIFLALLWGYYKRRILRYEESSLFTGVSDGHGRTPKKSFIGLMSILSIMVPFLTIGNIYEFIFKK